MSSTQKHSNYYAGFDYLRAALSLAVIAIHTKLLATHGNFSFDDRFGINVFDIVHFNVFFLAVPVFFIISLFLFYKKDESLLKSGRRIYHLLVLYVFWTGTWILFKDTRPDDGILGIILYIMRGGKSIFWFFLSLTIATVLAALTRKLSTKLAWIALALSTLAVALFPLLNIYDPTYRYLVAFWNPLQFIPYVFAAKLFVHYENVLSSGKRIQFMLLMLFVVLCCVEWATLVHPNHQLVQIVQIPLYTRVSVVAGASLFFVAALQIKRPPPSFIKALSSASLGMYCVHPFLISLTLTIRNEVTGIAAIAYFLAIAIASLMLTYGLREVLRQRLV